MTRKHRSDGKKKRKRSDTPSRAPRGVVGFNRQYVQSGHYGEVWDFFWSSR